MISFRNFALRRGERLLLSDVDLTLQAGWRVGVVGRNGTGKSSLFAALMRQVEADKGDLDLPGKARIASVAQETPSLPDAAIDFVLSGDAAVHAAIQAEANAFAGRTERATGTDREAGSAHSKRGRCGQRHANHAHTVGRGANGGHGAALHRPPGMAVRSCGQSGPTRTGFLLHAGQIRNRHHD